MVPLDDAEGGVGDVGIWSGEVDPVEGIEEIRTELEVVVFNHFCCLRQGPDRRSFAQGCGARNWWEMLPKAIGPGHHEAEGEPGIGGQTEAYWCLAYPSLEEIF